MRSLVSPTEINLNPTALSDPSRTRHAIRAPRRVARIAILALKSKTEHGRAGRNRNTRLRFRRTRGERVRLTAIRYDGIVRHPVGMNLFLVLARLSDCLACGLRLHASLAASRLGYLAGLIGPARSPLTRKRPHGSASRRGSSCVVDRFAPFWSRLRRRPERAVVSSSPSG